MVAELQAGKLQIKIYETRGDMGAYAADDAECEINRVIAEKGECTVIFAAAPSQNEFLSSLCNKNINWAKVNAFHMDEYIGLPAEAPQRFGAFLKKAIFSRVPFKNVNYICGDASNIDQEIDRYSSLLVKYPVDIVFMGIGENGHIAFNDPHVAHFDDTKLMQKVELDLVCRQQQVNDGCFAELDDVPKSALTLTIPALINACCIFCIVPAESKAKAVRETVKGEIHERLPASILRMHPKATMYLDQMSAKYILNP